MQERVPTILVSDGWEIDENDALAEIVIPATVETYNAPQKVTFLGETLNWIPSTTAALQEFEAPNLTSVAVSQFKGYNALKTLSLGVTSITYTSSPSTSVGVCYGCTSLTQVSMPYLTSVYERHVNGSSTQGNFYGCTSLNSVYMPELHLIVEDAYNNGSSSFGMFYKCTSLESVILNKLAYILVSLSGNTNNARESTFGECTSLKSVSFPSFYMDNENSSVTGAFLKCTALESVTLGSIGHAVSALGSYMFNGCTQSGLTITVYTVGGASLANEPWGATNATIVYETA